MSINKPEQRTNQSLPPYPHDKRDTVVPPPEHRDDKYDKKGLGWKKPVAAGAAVLAAVGGGLAFNSMAGGEEAPEKAPGRTLVLGPDGEPLKFVPYDPEINNDRDGNGIDDAFNDSDNDGAMDALQDWDQEAQMYVDKNAEYNQQVLDGASQEDLSSIAEIESVYPGIDGVKPSWKADFILLDPLVKRFVLEELSRRSDFATEDDWKSAVLYAFSLTPEEIEAAANNYE